MGRDEVRKLFILGMCVFAAGCTMPSYPAKNLVSLGQITQKMSKDEVQARLGDSVVIGYEIADEAGTNLKPIKIKNPQRVEIFQRGRRTFEVMFYLTQIRQADDKITDDELTPLVFENNQLIGQGWQFLNQILKSDGSY